jgi:ferredoxin
VLLGYALVDNTVEFSETKGLTDLPLRVSDIQGPGYYELREGFRFRHGFSSPKWYLLPPEHRLLVVTPSYEASDALNSSERRAVLFGVKPCDLRAITVLDKILLGKHPIYTLKRRSVVGIIVEECLEPGNTCFCALVGSGPTATSNFDLAYARLDENTVLFKPLSKLGYELVEALSLREAAREYVEAYYSAVERATSTMLKRAPSLREVVRALEKSINSEELWRSLSEECTGCGNCNYVCPTCFCTEIVDRVEETRSTRVALWAGCLTYTYGLVAGGHFRRELYTRYRHFILHKFLFYPRQAEGLLGCVGCGRCITWCPLGLDLREALSRVVREVE